MEDGFADIIIGDAVGSTVFAIVGIDDTFEDVTIGFSLGDELGFEDGDELG